MGSLQKFSYVLCIFSTITASWASEISDKYKMQAIGYLADTLFFKKIEIQNLVVRKVVPVCSFKCTKYDACLSFYVEDGACVFGLRDDVTEFANGDDVTPVDWQYLKMSYFGNVSIY